MNCIEIFENCYKKGDDATPCIEQAAPNFYCECSSCSVFSPGKVLDDERLIFLLIDPNHYDPVTGVITQNAFLQLTKRDLSVVRHDAGSVEDVQRTVAMLIESGRQRTPPQDRTVNEVCVVVAGDVRALALENERLFAVYDTALPEQRSHASIFTTLKIKADRNLRRIAVNRLYELMVAGKSDYKELLNIR